MMEERLKQVRTNMGLSQTDFAKRLGIGQSTLAMMEVGKRAISERHIKTVCALCKVREEWFRRGEGAMFAPAKEELLSELAAQYNLTPGRRAVVKAFLALTEEQQELLATAICSAADTIRREHNSTEPKILEPLPPIPTGFVSKDEFLR